MINWLPALIHLAEFGGDWQRYEDAIYTIFHRDFVESRPQLDGRRLGLKRHPLIGNKEATYWHFISEGTKEADRVPDLRRCERIAWPRAVIEHASDPAVKVWTNRRGQELRICLWLEEEEYVVILADRGSFLLPWTAYLVTQEHRKRKLLEEYLRSKSTP